MPVRSVTPHLPMIVLYLIRHAHAEWTPDEQRPLSPRGQEDARRLADLLCHLPVSRIYSSPFQRARQTVGPLAARLGLPVHIEPDLRERRLGGGLRVDDFLSAVRQTWRHPSYAHPGGESNDAAQRRGVAVLERLREQYPREHLVLSTHGNLMALVLQHYDARIDYGFWKALTMPDVYELRLEADKTSINRLWDAQKADRPSTMDMILHIARRDDWEKAQSSAAFRGDTLESEGFIHCSRPEQVVRVANSLYRGRDDLVLLCIDSSKVEAEIRYENLEGGDELFPHIYGPLNVAAVVAVLDFEPQADGTFTLPERLVVEG